MNLKRLDCAVVSAADEPLSSSIEIYFFAGLSRCQ